MERLKPIQRNASAAAAAEQESYRPELVTDEEPRYLRRQKPVEIRRKKLGGKTWPFYRRVFVWTLVGGTLATGVGLAARFALYSPQMLLIKPDQISITGNHVVPREEVLKLFVHDRNRSVLRIPLDARRTQLQEIPWVDEASVQRISAKPFASGDYRANADRVLPQWNGLDADRRARRLAGSSGR